MPRSLHGSAVRSQAKELLEHAGDDLAARGREPIAWRRAISDFPESRHRGRSFDRQLSATATQRRWRISPVVPEIQGGYLVLRFKSFLGTAPPRGKPALNGIELAPEKSEPPAQGRGESSLPELEADLIDIHGRRRGSEGGKCSFPWRELEGERPVTVAIRTALLEVDGRVAGASWVMTRLLDPLFVDASLQGYQLASGLAFGG